MTDKFREFDPQAFMEGLFGDREHGLDYPCPKCAEVKLIRTYKLMFGPYSGHVECCACGYLGSMYRFMADMMFVLPSPDDSGTPKPENEDE